MKAPPIPDNSSAKFKDYGDMRAAWMFDIHTNRTMVRFDSIVGDRLLSINFKQVKGINDSRLNFFAKRARRILKASKKE